MMTLLGKTLTHFAHSFHVYPHDGKNVVFIKDGELHQGVVLGSTAFTGRTKLEEINELHRLGILVEAANALRVPPMDIESRLNRGEMLVYRPRQERK